MPVMPLGLKAAVALAVAPTGTIATPADVGQEAAVRTTDIDSRAAVPGARTA